MYSITDHVCCEQAHIALPSLKNAKLKYYLTDLQLMIHLNVFSMRSSLVKNIEPTSLYLICAILFYKSIIA